MRIKKNIIYLFIPLILVTSCKKSDSDQGDQFYNNKQYEEAIVAFTDFLENNPRNINAIYTRGRSYEELGQLDEAETDFKSALALDDKNVQVLLSLSNLYQKMQKHELALLYADNATEIHGAPAMAFLLKGRAYHQLGNTEEAMKGYNSAIKRNPQFGQAFYYRGMLKLVTDKKQGACGDFKLAIDFNNQQANTALAQYCK
ncbi:MAG: tetratricopeptide repeat protein [Anditalea sp.]